MNRQIVDLLKTAMADMERGEYDKALPSLTAALAGDPDGTLTAEIYFQSGVCRYWLEEYDAAVESLEKALDAASGSDDDKKHIYELLRMAYRKNLDFQKLADICQTSERDEDITRELLFAYEKLGEWNKMVEILDELEMNAGNLANKVRCLTSAYRIREALSAAREYVERFGEDEDICAYLMQLYYDAGDPESGLKYFKKAVKQAENPVRRLMLGSVLLAKDLYYCQADDEEFFRIIGGMRRDSESLEVNRDFKNDLKPFRKIRLGYLSADLHEHPVGYFLLPVMVNTITCHSHIKCYSLTPHVFSGDTVMEKIRAYAGEWADVYERPDSYIEKMFLDDGIDIAFDMMCHSENNKLPLHARRMAPVQVSWIGFPVTTGVNAMDYVITDTCTDPPGTSEKYYTEKLLYMPQTYLCHILSDSPPVAEPAFERNGYITFACFHNLRKVTDKTLGLWRRILERTENSVLKVMGRIPPGEEAREMVEERFRRNGMPMDRVSISQMRGMNEYYAAYNEVDIILDTYPFSGATTTFDAFKMGRPVITLAGERHVTRVGYSMLRNVGLENLAAFTEDEYVEKAVRLANDPERLRQISKELPERLKTSALTDQQAFRRNYEKAIRDAWVGHCFDKRTGVHDYGADDFPELLEQVINATVYLGRRLEAGEAVDSALTDEYRRVQAAFYGKLETVVTDGEFVRGYGKLVELIDIRLDEAALDIAKRYLNVFCDGEL